MIKVYILRPKSLTDKKAAALVYARGGGAVMFEAEDFNETLKISADNLDCVIFHVGFRNGPENKCPGGQQDFMDAFLHIHENAEKYDVDSTKLAAGGISGGGWISLGAANLMVKSGDISKMNSLFINTGMLTDESAHVPKGKFMHLHEEEAALGI